MIWSPDNITTIVVAVIGGGLAALIAALFAGRKTRAEARDKEASAATQYEQLSARMETRYSDILIKYDQSQEEIRKLRDDVNRLQFSVAEKDRIITRLTARVLELEKQIPPPIS